MVLTISTLANGVVNLNFRLLLWLVPYGVVNLNCRTILIRVLFETIICSISVVLFGDVLMYC